MSEIDRKNYYKPLFGEWQSYETYVRSHIGSGSLQGEIDWMTDDEVTLHILGWSRSELNEFYERLPSPIADDAVDDDQFTSSCSLRRASI